MDRIGNSSGRGGGVIVRMVKERWCQCSYPNKHATFINNDKKK